MHAYIFFSHFLTQIPSKISGIFMQFYNVTVLFVMKLSCICELKSSMISVPENTEVTIFFVFEKNNGKYSF